MGKGGDSRLRSADTHFAFGRNWASFAEGIGDAEVGAAQADLRRLLGDVDLTGKRFLDIGCGSGLHSLAAIRLGAAHVTAVDIDADSVATTSAVLARHAPHADTRVEQCSVFDLAEGNFGTFDVVYSWGVLHHTGDMVTALRAASGMVGDEGVFLFALYRRTWLCGLWTIEKRWYASATPRAQRIAQRLYVGWYRILTGAARVVGRRRRNGGVRARGMEFHHDVHDWLGGFPYESILPAEVHRLMTDAGLTQRERFLCSPRAGRTSGLLGSGCDEYRYAR